MKRLFLIYQLIFISCFNSFNVFSQVQYVVNVSQSDPLSQTSICIVSVNSENKNIVAWNKLNNNYIDYIKVYRESTEQTEKWDSIGFVKNDSLSVFTDSSSEPLKQSYRYKISSVDRCGNETALSSHHKTMNLSIVKNISNSYSLIWDGYEGFDVSSYRIFRGTKIDSLKLIGSVASGNFTYNDSYLPKNSIFYQVETLSPDMCNVNDLKSASVYNSSRSNIVSNKSNYEGNLTIYPNPVFNKATINFPNPDHQEYTFSVFSITGKKVYSLVITDGKIEFEKCKLVAGVYLIEMRGSKTFRGKMIVVK